MVDGVSIALDETPRDVSERQLLPDGSCARVQSVAADNGPWVERTPFSGTKPTNLQPPSRFLRCGRSVSPVRLVLFLRSTETCLGTFVHALELPQSSDARGAQAVHLCPVEVIPLARVAGLRAQLLKQR